MQQDLVSPVTHFPPLASGRGPACLSLTACLSLPISYYKALFDTVGPEQLWARPEAAGACEFLLGGLLVVLVHFLLCCAVYHL